MSSNKKFGWDRDRIKKSLQKSRHPKDALPVGDTPEISEAEKKGRMLDFFQWDGKVLQRDGEVSFSEASLFSRGALARFDEFLAPLDTTVRDSLGAGENGVRIEDVGEGIAHKADRLIKITLTAEAFMTLAAAWSYDALRKLPKEQYGVRWDAITRDAKARSSDISPV